MFKLQSKNGQLSGLSHALDGKMPTRLTPEQKYKQCFFNIVFHRALLLWKTEPADDSETSGLMIFRPLSSLVCLMTVTRYACCVICSCNAVITINITVMSHEHHDISDHRSLERLLNSLFGLTSKKHQRSALLPFCEGNPQVTGGFPSQRAS